MIREFGYTHQPCCLKHDSALRLSFEPCVCSEHQVCIDTNSGSSSNKASHHMIGLVLSPPGRNCLNFVNI